MNVVDLFFIFLFIGALALGFFQGMIRQIILIVVFYVSVLLASIYFGAMASFLQQRSARIARPPNMLVLRLS